MAELMMMVITLALGTVAISFLWLEFKWSFKNVALVTAANTGIRRISLIWKLPKCFLPVLMDVAIVAFATLLFSFTGVVGSLLGMLASCIFSVNLYRRRKALQAKLAEGQVNWF